MMNSLSAYCIKSARSLISLLAVLMCLGAIGTVVPARAADEAKQPAAEQKPNEQADANSTVAASTVVARIGDYTITREELEQRVMRELYPNDFESFAEDSKPVDAETVLQKMLTEKAMMIEGREKGYLNREDVRTPINRFKQTKLVGLVCQEYIEANESKITPTEEEIKQKLMADPNATRERAVQAIRRVKGIRLLNQYYAEIYKKSNVRRLKQNFPKAVQIHQRLMTQPKKARKVNFIRTWQVRDELTQSEKDMVLVEFNGGKVTLYDWFNTLCDIVPPRRPRDLNTIAGVERLLDRSLSRPLLVARAKSLGLDRNEKYLKEVRDYEDRMLLGQIRSAKLKEAKQPTPEEITAYFNGHKKEFVTGRNLKVDMIWCKDHEEAEKVKADLNAGKSFDAVKKECDPNDKTKPHMTYAGSEGLFWKDLWAGEPNDVLGPLKGFHGQKVQWRIVKVLEKNPGKEREYSSNMDGQIKSRIMTERNDALMAQYSKELLEKHSHQIYADKIKDINPLNIP
jgi:hypothetical protein